MALIMENSAQKRAFPTIGDMVVMLLLFFVVQLGCGLILGALGVLPPTLSSVHEVDAEVYMSEQLQLGRYTALVYPLLMSLSLAVIWLYARLRGGKGTVKIGHSAAGLNPTIILVGVLWLVSAQVMLEPLTELLPKSESAGVGRGLWAWITIAIFAPILEELLCRGVLYGTIKRRWGVLSAIALSALFFGIIHFDPATVVVALVAGLIFGVLYERTSSIFSTMIIHSLNNIVAFELICFDIEDMSFSEVVGGGIPYYILYAVACVVFVAISVEACVKVFKKRKEETK
jgi:membrane protease YdiL (CAAX protease family)